MIEIPIYSTAGCDNLVNIVNVINGFYVPLSECVCWKDTGGTGMDFWCPSHGHMIRRYNGKVEPYPTFQFSQA
jgi:hypothetical protein